MMEKAVVGLIASLGIIGAIATKTSNKVKDAETFMANMQAQKPQVAWNDKVGQGIGVRKIPRNKINFTAFDKDLPAFIPKNMRADWDKLESANWQEINELGFSDYTNRGQNLSTQYNQLSLFGGGIEYPMNSSYLEYSNLASKISTLSQTYSQTIEYDAVKKEGKKALTAFKKLNANLEKGIKGYKRGSSSISTANMPKVAKYAAFKTFMDCVFNGAQALTKVRGMDAPNRKKFDEFMAQMKNPPASGVSFEFRQPQRYVLTTLRNLDYYDSSTKGLNVSRGLATFRNLVNLFATHPFTPTGFNPQDSPLYNLDLAMQDLQRVSYILDKLTVNEVARLYQYGMFFNDNPTIRFVGAKTRPYNKREELYFSKYAYRENMNTWQVLPKGLRLSEKRYVNVLSRRCVGFMRLLKSLESKADNLARVKEDAGRKNKENATKAVIEQVQKALDGKAVEGRYGQNCGRLYEKTQLTAEQKADLALALIEYPTYTMPALSILPSIEIETYFGQVDEKGMPVLESRKGNLMQNTGLLNTVEADEVLKGLTLDPAMKGQIQNRLSARYQQAVASNDRSIANLAQQMTRYIQNKDKASKQYNKALNLVDFAF